MLVLKHVHELDTVYGKYKQFPSRYTESGKLKTSGNLTSSCTALFIF